MSSHVTKEWKEKEAAYQKQYRKINRDRLVSYTLAWMRQRRFLMKIAGISRSKPRKEWTPEEEKKFKRVETEQDSAELQKIVDELHHPTLEAIKNKRLRNMEGKCQDCGMLEDYISSDHNCLLVESFNEYGITTISG